jgi:hypothetical protein
MSKAKKNPNDVPALPSAGGTTRAGKDSTNCDDSRGEPGRHHQTGKHEEAKVQEGRGPAAAKKQLGRNWMKGTPEPDR